MFMEVGEEIKDRRKALVRALRAAVQAGLPEAYVREVKEIVLGQYFGVFRRALTGEPPARLEPMRVTLKQGAGLSKVKAKPRRYPSDSSAYLGNISSCSVTRGWCTRTRRRCARVWQWPFPKDRARVTVWWPISLPSMVSLSSCQGR